MGPEGFCRHWPARTKSRSEGRLISGVLEVFLPIITLTAFVPLAGDVF